MQLLQIPQCELLGGLKIKQVFDFYSYLTKLDS